MNNLEMEAAGERADSTKDANDKTLKHGKGDSALRLSSSADRVHLQWQRVEDELPERNLVVLVCFKSGYDNSLMRAMLTEPSIPEDAVGARTWYTRSPMAMLSMI